MDVKGYYDDFVTRQTAVGVNERHHAVLSWLQRFGMSSCDNVLELGCGVGTATELIAEAVPQGSVLGVDLSPKSIEAAQARLEAFSNVRLLAADLLKVEIPGRYDVVVLADVIEHVPLNDHAILFQRVASWVAPEGFVLLHYPNPQYLEWCHVHRPQNLQIIDQPVHADVLLANVYAHGMYLDYFERYSIWVREGDYVVAALRPAAGIGNFTDLPGPRRTVSERVWRRAVRIGRRLVAPRSSNE